MNTVSVWHAGAPATSFTSLPGDAETDVVIVGGGITGITLAALLADAGRRVVVLEAQRVGEGTTGHSTASELPAAVSGPIVMFPPVGLSVSVTVLLLPAFMLLKAIVSSAPGALAPAVTLSVAG